MDKETQKNMAKLMAIGTMVGGLSGEMISITHSNIGDERTHEKRVHARDPREAELVAGLEVSKDPTVHSPKQAVDRYESDKATLLAPWNEQQKEDAQEENKDRKKIIEGAAIGAVVGGFTLPAGALATGAVYNWRKRRENEVEEASEDEERGRG